MSLITLFSAPKAFTDPATALAQRNAIGSWKQLPDVDVLLLGHEDGLEEAAREIGVRYSPDVAFNPNGVPLISSMLKFARESGDSPLLCIVNADIVLLPDFVDAARQVAALMSPTSPTTRPVSMPGASVRRRSFFSAWLHRNGPSSEGPSAAYLFLSRRWDLDVNAPIAFAPGWEAPLLDAVHRSGQLHRPAGSDIFLFPRDCYLDMPDFAIGRAGWDNWMIYKARKEGWPVIDATPCATVIHQNHDYRHLPGARPHYDHPDTQVNTRLAGGQAATRYSVLDTTLMLANGRLLPPPMTNARFMRRLELFLRRILFFLPEGAVESLARPQRWRKRFHRLMGKARR